MELWGDVPWKRTERMTRAGEVYLKTVACWHEGEEPSFVSCGLDTGGERGFVASLQVIVDGAGSLYADGFASDLKTAKDKCLKLYLATIEAMAGVAKEE